MVTVSAWTVLLVFSCGMIFGGYVTYKFFVWAFDHLTIDKVYVCCNAVDDHVHIEGSFEAYGASHTLDSWKAPARRSVVEAVRRGLPSGTQAELDR